MLAVAALACASAHADDGFGIKFSGFGTLGAVHSNDDTSDFLGGRFQPKGAGHTHSTSLTPDSKLGGQVNATLGHGFSAVVQVVSQYQAENNFTPKVEWANLKYQITPELSVRLGRIAAPTYLLSESRFVGYAAPWVRPPTEVYGVVAITSNDGIDATYRSQIAGVNNAVQAFYGKSKVTAGENVIKSRPSWGINDSVEFGSFTLRAGYNAFNLNLEIPSSDALFGGLRGLAAGLAQVPLPAFQTASAQALDAVQKSRITDLKISAFALGLNYDPGNWFAMGEFVRFKGDGFLVSSVAWYGSVGYRFGSLTPYVAYSAIKPKYDDTHITTAGLEAVPALAGGAAALNAGVDALFRSGSAEQHTVAVGLRWDFMANFALKGQYERVTTAADSPGNLRTYPGYVGGRGINVVSVALDFVF